MNRYKKDDKYLLIIDDILKNAEFSELKNIKHHNTNRLDHCLKVSYYSYKIAKCLRLDYEEVARGGLLHDFYKGEISDCNKIKDKVLLFSTRHPNEALNNSASNFELTEKEMNIIKTHMFPIDYRVPKYAESWVVNLVDKALSFGEFSKKFSYKLIYESNLYLLFIFNIVK